MAQSTGPMQCLACGYVIDAIPSAQCPECGRAFDPSDPATFDIGGKRRTRRRVLRVVIGVAALGFLTAVLAYAASHLKVITVTSVCRQTALISRRTDYALGGTRIWRGAGSITSTGISSFLEQEQPLAEQDWLLALESCKYLRSGRSCGDTIHRRGLATYAFTNHCTLEQLEAVQERVPELPDRIHEFLDMTDEKHGVAATSLLSAMCKTVELCPPCALDIVRNSWPIYVGDGLFSQPTRSPLGP